MELGNAHTPYKENAETSSSCCNCRGFLVWRRRRMRGRGVSFRATLAACRPCTTSHVPSPLLLRLHTCWHGHRGKLCKDGWSSGGYSCLRSSLSASLSLALSLTLPLSLCFSLHASFRAKATQMKNKYCRCNTNTALCVLILAHNFRLPCITCN